MGRVYRITVFRQTLSALMLLAACVASDSSAQTHFPGGEADEAPCPPAFPALYTKEPYGTFWGRSHLSMVDPGGSYAYAFSGATRDGLHRIRGNHYVARSQCTTAAYHYWLGIPAVILRLWNESISVTGSAGCYGDQFEHDVNYDPFNPTAPDCPGGGGGGGDGDGGGVDCRSEYIVVEVSFDGGNTWILWWQGTALVCE
jgi:hypothetical protein